MTTHKLPNRFYNMAPPIKPWRNHKAKCWRLLDKNNTIIADNLTEESAETLSQAVNFCSPSLNFIKLFIEHEYMMSYDKSATNMEVAYRSEIFNQALSFMVELGLVDPPPKYVNILPMWRDQLIEDFKQNANNLKHKDVVEEEENFINIYKKVMR